MLTTTFPSGVSANVFLLVIISEFLCLIVTLACTILGLVNLVKGPNRLKALVWGIFLTFSLTVLLLVISELFWWFGLIITLEQYNFWNQTASAFVVLINIVIVWTFQVDVFVAKGPDQRRDVLIFYGIVIIIAVGFFTTILNLTQFSGLLILLVIIEYGIIIRRSIRIANQLKDEKFNHNHMVLLGTAAVIMLTSYILTTLNGALADIIPPYSFLYHIAAWFGAIAIFIWYFAFFTPNWLLLKWVDLKTLPEVDTSMHPITWNDELPQVKSEDIPKNEHCVEWWYFDWQDTQSQAKVVAILKRYDSTTYIGFGGVHLEWTSPDGKEEKFYRKVKYDQFNVKEEDGMQKISINANNWYQFEPNEDGTIGKMQLHIDLDTVKLDLDANPASTGFKLGPDGYYYFSKLDPKIRSGASISVPFFKGNATLSVKGATFQMDCVGYHDHPFGTADLLDTHHQWYWMRAINGDNFVMYAQVTPHKLYYGLIKYLYIIPHEGMEAITDTEFTINASQFSKFKLIKFPHVVQAVSKKLGVIIDMKFKEIHWDQQVYNRSLFDMTLTSEDLSVTGNALVEYYYMAPFTSKLARMMVHQQYDKWIKNTP
jgi:hypothetical protein